MPKRPTPPTAAGGSWKKKKYCSPPQTHPSKFPTLTPKDAIVLLQGYLGWLRNSPQNGGSSHCSFSRDSQDHVTATLTLPSNSPITQVYSSGVFLNDKDAKQDAAYNAILALHAAGEFNDRLVPTPKNATNPIPPVGAVQLVKDVTDKIFGSRKLSSARAAAQQDGGPREKSQGRQTSRSPDPEGDRSKRSKTDAEKRQSREEHAPSTYSCQRPRFWHRNTITNDAFGAVLTFQFQGEFERRAADCRPLLLVTAKPLPFGEEVVLNTKEADVSVRGVLGKSAPLNLTPQELDLAFEWTRLCIRAVMNHPLDCRLEDCGWLILPLSRVFSSPTATRADVAWGEVLRVERGPVQNFDPVNLDDKELRDAVLSWPKEFCRRYYFKRIRHDLRPYSICPRDSSRTILELIGGQRRPPRIDHPQQDVIEGLVAYGANHNGCVGSFTASWKDQHLVPELLRIHMLCAGVFKSATLLPQAITVLEEHLLAFELSSACGGLDHKLVRSALGVPSTGEDSYERLKWLGWAVRRVVCSIGAFHNIRDDNSRLERERQKTMSSRHLISAVVDAGVPGYIRRGQFAIDGWAPDKWVYEDGTRVSVPTKQRLNDKILADVGDALVGAAYLSSNMSMPATVKHMISLGGLKAFPTWDELRAGLAADRDIPPTPHLTIMGNTFCSEIPINIPVREHDQQLFSWFEFLGLALLHFLTFEHIWLAHPEIDEVQLAIMKESRVSLGMRSAFSATCIFDSINVEDSVSVNTYRESMLHARAAADEAAAAGEPEYEFWSSTPDTHGLSSLLPVILGAMFKASSGDIDPVRKAYTDHIAPFQVKYGAPAIRSNRVGPKALLHHQLELHGCESWRIAQGGGDEPGALFQASVYVHDHVAGASTSHTAQAAIRNACDNAIRAGLDRLLQRVCSCRSRG